MIEFFNDKQTWTVRNKGLYSDNTPMVKPGENVYNDIVANATGVEIRVTDISGLFTGLAFVSGISRSGGHIKTLVLPYIPGARQDRVNPTGDVLDTLSVVADMKSIQILEGRSVVVRCTEIEYWCLELRFWLCLISAVDSLHSFLMEQPMTCDEPRVLFEDGNVPR